MTLINNINMNREIQQMVETKKSVYLLDPNEIISAYRREVADIEGYHGRELLELLQNAVDELESATDKFVHIELSGNILKFSNNGSVFTTAGITSLMYTNFSPKFNNRRYIGNKGTGFRSVLNWSNSVKIFSGSLSVKFSADSADELLCELLKAENITAFKKQYPDLKIATLVAPKIIAPLASSSFDTVIEICIKDEMLENVKEQISNINATTLLFLNNLERLTVICDGEAVEYRKPSLTGNGDIQDVKIDTYVDGQAVVSDEYKLSVRQGAIENQLFSVSVAYKPDMSIMPDVLYSFFKTKVSFPVPALIHGTFDLDANRNHLNETPLNKAVLEEACRLLISITRQMCSAEVNYAPLKLLSLRTDFPNELSWAKLNEFYLDEIANSEVFPTVNGEYIIFSQDVKFYKSDISDLLSGGQFSKLLIYSDELFVTDFLGKLSKRKGINPKYGYSYVVQAIDELLKTLTLSERAALCMKFLHEYGSEVKNATAPKFMLDSQGRTVSPEQLVFLPPVTTEENFPQPPDFARLVFMNKDLLLAFRGYIGENHDLRAISLMLAKLNVNEYGLTDIIRSTVSKFNSRENKESKNTLRCCIDLVSWLFKLYKTKRIDSLNVQGFPFKIPMLTRERKVVNADLLYIGTDYGNNITENLLVGKSGVFVAPPNTFNISQEELPLFNEFMIKLTVAKFPRITIKSFRPSVEYKERLVDDFPYPFKANEYFIKTEDDAKSSNIYSVYVESIEGYEHILQYARTEHILEWLNEDYYARTLVTSRYETNSQSRGHMTRGLDRNGRTFYGETLSCFMRYEFARTPWVEIDGERYAPYNCLLQGSIGKRLSPFIVVPDFTAFIKQTNRPLAEIAKVKMLLAEIGAAETYGDLSADSLYGILLMLPSIDHTGEISKALYKAVIDARGSTRIDKNNSNFIKFMTEGQVFCKNTRSYERINKSWYMTEKSVSDAVLEGYNLIAIPPRQSQTNILRYFGVHSLKLKGKIVGSPVIHGLNSNFAADFYNFKKYAFCYRMNNAKQPEISAIKTLKVVLCDSVVANYDDGDAPLSNYAFIRGADGKIYIKIPNTINTIESARLDIDFCAAIADIFTSTIGIYDDNLYTCLRSLYGQRESGRQKMIVHDFDDLRVLTEAGAILEHTQSRKDMFVSAIEQIGGTEIMPFVLEYLERIDFENIADVANGGLMREILSILGVDVIEFNERSEFDIDLRPFYLDSLQKLTDDNKFRYKNLLFDSLVSENLRSKEKFLRHFDNYSNFVYVTKNTIVFDINTYFLGIWNLLNGQTELEADNEWKRHRELFISGKNIDIINDLFSRAENESLLYFGELDVLLARYVTKESEWKERDEIEGKLKNLPTTPIAPVKIISTENAPSKEISPNKPKHGKGSRTVGMRRERNKSEWGAYAEKVVFQTFLNKDEYLDVDWVSENAKKEGINPNGMAGYGYDLTYKNIEGETKFVEIKSTSGEALSFIMTSNELLVAEEKGSDYIVALVTNLEDESKMSINIMPDLFSYAEGEHRFSNSRFTLSADDYTVLCVNKKAGSS